MDSTMLGVVLVLTFTGVLLLAFDFIDTMRASNAGTQDRQQFRQLHQSGGQPER